MAERSFEQIRDGTDRSIDRVLEKQVTKNLTYVPTEIFTSENGEDALVEARGNTVPPPVLASGFVMSPTSPAFVPSGTNLDSRSSIKRQTSMIKGCATSAWTSRLRSQILLRCETGN